MQLNLFNQFCTPLPKVSGIKRAIGIVIAEPNITPIIGCTPILSVIRSKLNAKIELARPTNTHNPKHKPLIFVGNNSEQ